MKIGFRIETSTRRLVLAIDPDHFHWTPGEIESGWSAPGEYFDAWKDQHWLWGWLGFTIFYARSFT